MPRINAAAHLARARERALFVRECDEAQRARGLAFSKRAGEMQERGDCGSIVVCAGRILVRVIMRADQYNFRPARRPFNLGAYVCKSAIASMVLLQARNVSHPGEGALAELRRLRERRVVVEISRPDLDREHVHVTS